jgi:HK97 gp10 family phage protein
MEIKIDWEGLDELCEALERRADTSAVKSVVSANGARLQSKAMRNAPIDTGALMRSIGLTLKDGGLTAEVQPAMEYAAYVEYGTRFMEAQPYLRPAFDEVKQKFISDLKTLVK